uniref:Sodium channel regulatory subunit beta-3 n=1 Tax=Neogobius melanostomus TaxID=47308 RepID=A0A8C6T0J1_9GOBI
VDAIILLYILLLVLCLSLPHALAACSEVDSMTEAVAGKGHLLGCISCKRREEVSASTTVDWHFRPPGELEYRHIFHYKHPTADILDDDFSGRLEWRGTQHDDIQIGAVYLSNVTFNDSGTYLCTLHRTLFLPVQNEEVSRRKGKLLTCPVIGAITQHRGWTSEIMMFVLIVVLQLWLILVLVYCYKKISADHERREAKKALKCIFSSLALPKSKLLDK